MRQIADDVRRARQKRLLARGAPPEYQDPATYQHVERALGRAIAARDAAALLFPDLLDRDLDWRMNDQPRVSSHRRFLGPIIVFIKRRLFLPITRPLFEYTQDNFRRQQHINELLMACVEELAIENAKLQKQAAQAGSAALPDETSADDAPGGAGRG
jgi:hypothetical protein